MGGGVSLGAFSGAALTEALQLLVMYGQDADGNPYKKVVVDGMSGASAGAISLAIMLRCLIDYKSMLSLDHIKNGVKGKSGQFITKPLNETILMDELEKKFGSVPTEKKEALVALQLAQNIQHQCWVDRVNADELFGDKLGTYVQDPFGTFSLLDRKVIKELTKDYLLDGCQNMDPEKVQVLSKDRAIFACSLTNLLPITSYNKVSRYANPQLVKNLQRSIASQKHGEVRVFDFIFNPAFNDRSSSRWIKVKKEGVNSEVPSEKGLNDTEAWSMFSASAIACGAFQFAFEPVRLKRFRTEYQGEDWPLFPEHSVSTQNSFFNEGETLDYSTFNFPYVDGGTFNNEPIKEAFRIANFNDFYDRGNNDSFDRLVLFVDPIVSKENPKFTIKAYNPVKFKLGKDKHLKSLEKASELSKILPLASTNISTLQHEGSVKEMHKSNLYVQHLNLKNELELYLGGTKLKMFDGRLFEKVLDKIKKDFDGQLIPYCSGDELDYLAKKISHKCINERCSIALKQITREKLSDFRESILDLDQSGVAQKAKDILGLSDSDLFIFSNAFFSLVVEVSLDTTGKDENAVRAAITPTHSLDMGIVNLPGSEIAAFGGFASFEARKYAFDYARLSSIISLEESDFRDYYNRVMPNDLNSSGNPKPFIGQNGDALKTYKEQIINNLKSSNFYTDKDIYARNIKSSLYDNAYTRITNLVSISFLKGLGLAILTSIFSTPVILFRKLIGKYIYSRFAKKDDSLRYDILPSINIVLRSQNKLSRKIKFHLHDGKSRTVKMVDLGKNQGTFKYLFKLFYAETDEVFVLNNVIRNKIRFTTQGKVPISLKDPNLDFPESKHLSISQFVIGFSIDGKPIPFLEKNINDPDSSLFHSLREADLHINPSLELDVKDFRNDNWLFVEQTLSLCKELNNLVNPITP